MHKNYIDEIEFHFSRFGGHARGRFAIIILAALITLAMILTAIIWIKATSFGAAFYDHRDGLHSQAMTASLLHPPLEGGSKFAEQISGRGMPHSSNACTTASIMNCGFLKTSPFGKRRTR